MASDAIAKRETVKGLLEQANYKQRFNEVLGQKAPLFMASLCALSAQRGLAECDPKGVIASAFTAATLDLPIERNLGFAWVIPYKDKGNPIAQFQMGYKGYIQLALRSGQFKRLAAIKINAEAFKGFDNFHEPIIDMNLVDEDKPAVGYMVAWELVNGFTKTCYWTKAKIDAHAGHYSKAFKTGRGDSPWTGEYDKMALKTVVSNSLRQWAPLSVQMQKALVYDQSAQADIDAEPVYIDNEAIDVMPQEPDPATVDRLKKAGKKDTPPASGPCDADGKPLDGQLPLN